MSTKTDDFRRRLQEQLAALDELIAAGQQARENAQAAADEETGQDDDPSAEFRAQMERDIAALEAALGRVNRSKAADPLERKAARPEARRKGMLGDLWSWLTNAGPTADESWVRRNLRDEYSDVDDEAALDVLIDLFIRAHGRWETAIADEDDAFARSSEQDMSTLRSQMDDLRRGEKAASRRAERKEFRSGNTNGFSDDDLDVMNEILDELIANDVDDPQDAVLRAMEPGMSASQLRSTVGAKSKKSIGAHRIYA